MFDMFKANRINKLTPTHSEKISDYMILLNMVNSMDVQKKVSSEDFSKFRFAFQSIAARREEKLTNSLQYEHRAFTIAYELEELTGIPYQKMCGDATDILYMYTNRKPQVEAAITESTEEAMGIIQTVISSAGNGDLKLFAYVLTLLRCLLIQVGSRDERVYDNKITIFMIDKVINNIYKNIDQIFKLRGTPNGKRFDDYCDEIVKLNAEAVRNTKDLDNYMDSIVNSVLYLCNIPSSPLVKRMVLDWINKWRG